jgi:hypothetical protein
MFLKNKIISHIAGILKTYGPTDFWKNYPREAKRIAIAARRIK